MANALYPAYKELLLNAGLNLASGDIRAILIDTADYTYGAAHDFLDDVAAGARVATTSAFASKTTTNGTFDAADLSFSAVTGDVCEALIIYCHDGGADSARRLIGYFDTGVTGLPVTPNGGDVTITWNASGIFAL